MSAETIATHNTVASQMRGLALLGRPHIDITLKDQQDAYLSTYTNLDTIEGEIVIKTSSETRFDNLQISLEGISKTYVEKMSPTPNAHSEARHLFLKLRHPIDELMLPQPRVLEVGRIYRYPFTFIIPERLLPTICQHPCEREQVHEAHLQLPPSLGDPAVAGDGNILLDDMAPAMSRVTYSIRAKLTRARESDGRDVTVAEGSKKIRVQPASEELPPLTVDAESEEYVLRKHKNVSKGLFKGYLGCLSIEAAQPKSLRLPPVRSISSALASTMAIVAVRFDPAKEKNDPPRLGQLVTKLKVKTHYASEVAKDFPLESKAVYVYSNGHRGSFSETIQLSSRCMESVQWERHDVSEEADRDSNISTSSTSPLAPLPQPTPHYRTRTFYTAKILVPITLPKGKLFVPTFHSCLISRVYILELSLSASKPNANTSLSGTTLNLRLPLQISSSGMNIPTMTETEAEAAAEADEHLRPRTISPLPGAYIATSDLSPGRSEQTQQQASPSSAARQEEQTPGNPTSDSSQGPPPGYSFLSMGGASQVPVRIPSPVGISPPCG